MHISGQVVFAAPAYGGLGQKRRTGLKSDCVPQPTSAAESNPVQLRTVAAGCPIRQARWGYGHAVNAGITLLGFIALALSALVWAE